MTTVESSLKTLLGNLVSGRCYPVINTSPTIVRPYITFQLIDGREILATASTTYPEERHFQIDIFADDYNTAKTLEASVKSAMRGASFQNVSIMFQDLYEEESKEFRQILEYSIWS